MKQHVRVYIYIYIALVSKFSPGTYSRNIKYAYSPVLVRFYSTRVSSQVSLKAVDNHTTTRHGAATKLTQSAQTLSSNSIGGVVRSLVVVDAIDVMLRYLSGCFYLARIRLHIIPSSFKHS